MNSLIISTLKLSAYVESDFCLTGAQHILSSDSQIILSNSHLTPCQSQVQLSRSAQPTDRATATFILASR